MRITAVFLPVFAFCCVAFAAPATGPNAAPTASTAPSTAAPTPPAAAAPAIAAAPELAATPLPQSTLTSAFQNGLAAFQKQDFKTARLWFRECLAKDPQQIVAWYDLGLTEAKLGNAGLAMAFWRKALALSPHFQSALHALAYTKAHLDKSDIPHEVETWESLHSDVLTQASASTFSLITCALLFMAGWFALSYIGKRRRAILDEKPLPAFPLAAVIATALFVVSTITSVCKFIDDTDLRATIVAKKVSALALPDTASTSLFDLYEGLEVIVRQQNKSWVQVTYPGGATGWIPRDSLFTMSDRIQ